MIATYADHVAHVQIADAPGRHEPGTGEIDLDGYLAKLEAAGCGGWVALEHMPRADTIKGLGWLPPAHRSGEGAHLPARASPRRPRRKENDHRRRHRSGHYGGPMAGNLVKAGYDVIGYNRGATKIDQLVLLGGRRAADVTEGAREADVVLAMLPDSPDVEEVVLGRGGVLESARPGTLLNRRGHHPARVLRPGC